MNQYISKSKLSQCTTLIAATVVFYAVYCFIVSHFYINGAYLLDSGWFAGLNARNNFLLNNPIAIGGGSYLATHISPILEFLIIGKTFLPDLNSTIYFAYFFSFLYALIAWSATFFIFNFMGSTATNFYTYPVYIVFGVLFALSGTSLNTLMYPHFEPIAVPFLTLFFYYHLRQKFKKSLLFFILSLFVREDVGFHIFGIFFVLLLIEKLFKEDVQLNRNSIKFMIIALLYSILAIIIQKAIFNSDNAFRRIYLGSPAFGHVNFELIYTRISFLLTDRFDLTIPLVLTGAYAFIRRKIIYIAAYIAFVPWFVLNLLAFSNAAGTFFSYYSYPFLLASIWPLIIVVKNDRSNIENQILFISYFLFLASSFVLSPSGLFSNKIEQKQILVTDSFLDFVLDKAYLRNEMVFSPSVAALRPNDISRNEIINDTVWADKKYIIYFKNDYSEREINRFKVVNNICRSYEIEGTELIFSTTNFGAVDLLPNHFLYSVNDVCNKLNSQELFLQKFNNKIADGSPWDSAGTVIFKNQLDIDLPSCLIFSMIEISLDSNDDYLILYYDRQQLKYVPLSEVDGVNKVGMFSRKLTVKTDLCTDKIRIVPLRGDGKYSLGHLIIR